MTIQTPDDVPPRVDYVALPPGATVGRYRILGVLGQGGFGITYLARDAQLDREVALKEYLPAALAVRLEGASVLPRSTEVADDFGWGRERFIEEGRTLASLHDAPSIVRVFDFVEANGTAYMVMERLRGETLEHRVAVAGPLAFDALEAILWPLLAGLQTVHEAGFLHRDIKPANVILADDGRATLIDFGASRAAMADRTRTMTAIFTPGYAAPEQFTSARQGPWTDIYSFAATLHFAAIGRPPPAAFDRLMEDAYEPLSAGPAQGLGESMVNAIDAGLVLPVEQRPRSIAQWRSMLRGEAAVGEHVPGEATIVMPQLATPEPGPPPTPPTPPTPPSSSTELTIGGRATRTRWLTIFAVGAGALIAVGLYVGFVPARMPVDAVMAPAPLSASGASQATQSTPQPAEAEESGESMEAALRLGANDRRRIQMALTAQGFDTRGSDGSFGPRSREMIADWQKARGHAATGYLTRSQSQALLQAAPALPAASQPSSGAVANPVAAGGVFVGSLSGSATGGGQSALPPMAVDLRVNGPQLVGRLIHPNCGALPVQLAISSSGAVSGNLELHESGSCSINPASATGQLAGGSLTLVLHGLDASYRGALSAPARPAPETLAPETPGPARQSPGQRDDVP